MMVRLITKCEGIGGLMAVLTIDLVFANISDEELSAAYDQTDEIEKKLKKIIMKLPLGAYLTEIDVY
jgi:hypothetical protein